MTKTVNTLFYIGKYQNLFTNKNVISLAFNIYHIMYAFELKSITYWIN